LKDPPLSLSASRNPRIDVLRGVSILAVLLLHFTLTYRLGASPLATLLGKPLLRALLINGNFGVTMFFTISGFLITAMALERHGSLAAIGIRAFYRRRFARILPCLLVAMAIILLLAARGWPSFSNHRAGMTFSPVAMAVVLGSVLTFWHNLLMASWGYFNYAVNIYWSLSVEEVFYLGFPLLCALLGRRRWILLLCALAILAGPLYRHLHRADEIRYLYGYLACFDAIAMGCGAAILAERFPLAGRTGKVLQVLALLLVAGTYLRGIDGHVTFSFTLVALGIAILLLGSGAGSGRIAGSRALAWLRWLGRHSYELYLFHIIILGVLRDLLPRARVADAAKLPLLALFLALSALAAALVARFWSEPLNRALRARSAAEPIP
jgi:peptidoglycan/LPS O-acetylase OafA/YrhL